MIKAKTGIKLMRHLGVVLIALPEPITTPFGVALGLASHYLSRRLEASLNKRFRETLKQYLAHFKRFSDDADGVSSVPKRVKGYTRSEEHLILRQDKGSCSLEAHSGALVWQSWHDTRDKIVHHTVDMESLSRRYGMQGGAKVEAGASYLEVVSGSTEKLRHHSIDIQMLAHRYQADDSSKVEPDWSDISRSGEEVIYHTINMESLSRYYKSERGTGADSNWASASGSVEGVTHHSVNMRLLSQRFQLPL